MLTSVEHSCESNGLKNESQRSDKVVGPCLLGTSVLLPAVWHVTATPEGHCRSRKLVADSPRPIYSSRNDQCVGRAEEKKLIASCTSSISPTLCCAYNSRLH